MCLFNSIRDLKDCFFFHVCSVFLALRIVAHQVPLSVGLSRQKYWSGLPFPPTGDLPDPGIEPASSAALALTGGSLPISSHLLCHSFIKQ